MTVAPDGATVTILCYALAPIAKCKTIECTTGYHFAHSVCWPPIDERSILNAQEDARIQHERDKKQYEKDRAAMYAEREKTNAFLRKHGYTWHKYAVGTDDEWRPGSYGGGVGDFMFALGTNVDFWCRGQRVVRWQNSCLTCV